MLKKNGFTLIELLVVIAIIALLLSIITPALKKAKDQARLAICASNQHQVTIGVSTVTASNGGKIPENVCTNKNGTAIWWDHPWYLACHAPYPIVGSYGTMFNDVLPSVNVWFCPLSPMKPDSKAPTSGTDKGLSYEQVYQEPDPKNYTWVPMTTMALWKYGGFNDSLLTRNIPAFVGAGLDRSNSNIVIGDVVFWYKPEKKWYSGHPYRAGLKSGFFWEGPGERGLIDEINGVSYTFGYLDGSVKRFRSEEMIKQDDGRNQVYCLPDQSAWR